MCVQYYLYILHKEHSVGVYQKNVAVYHTKLELGTLLTFGMQRKVSNRIFQHFGQVLFIWAVKFQKSMIKLQRNKRIHLYIHYTSRINYIKFQYLSVCISVLKCSIVIKFSIVNVTSFVGVIDYRGTRFRCTRLFT